MAPLIIGKHVLVGVSGDFDNLQGFVRSIDAETGATQWQWDATPPVGTPNRTTGRQCMAHGHLRSCLSILSIGELETRHRPEWKTAARR